MSKEIVFDNYCFEYTDRNEDDTTGTTEYYMLTDAQIQLINNIISADNSNVSAWEKFETEDIVYICTIDKCSNDMLFKIPSISVWKHNGDNAYYIADNAYSYTAYQESDGSSIQYVYKVDDRYNYELLKMLEPVL